MQSAGSQERELPETLPVFEHQEAEPVSGARGTAECETPAHRPVRVACSSPARSTTSWCGSPGGRPCRAASTQKRTRWTERGLTPAAVRVSATVTATTDLHCYVMTLWDFRAFVQGDAEVAWKLLEQLAGMLQRQSAAHN